MGQSLDPTLFRLLDGVADSVNPLLAVIALALPLLRTVRQNQSPWLYLAFTVATVLIVYLIKFYDDTYHAWAKLGLDYSTHTAVAIALVVSIVSAKRSLSIILIAVFVAYAALMMYMGYHTMADIFVTGIILFLTTTLLHMIRLRIERTNRRVLEVPPNVPIE